MKVLVLKSSGNQKGSSNLLADEFIRGAKEAGHDVTEFDVFRADIRPCLGCTKCGMDGPCVQKDDNEKTLKGLVKAADMIAFVMPVYYYNWPAQLLAVVDRFYSYNGQIVQAEKKTALISAAWDDTDSVFKVVESFYRVLCGQMGFRNQGTVLGRDCGTVEKTGRSRYMKDAYELGRRV